MSAASIRDTRQAWIDRSANRTDNERVSSPGVGRKIRRWIDTWEFIKSKSDWTPVSDIPAASIFTFSKREDTLRRIRRRFVLGFRSAGLIDLKPWPLQVGMMTFFRVRKKPY